ncbi:MAG: hypothetical protein HYZ71_10360 [Deltaproteobacteria bacterium]|nr:hypothetical protein [Deltaproteobacteria bacterium]
MKNLALQALSLAVLLANSVLAASGVSVDSTGLFSYSENGQDDQTVFSKVGELSPETESDPAGTLQSLPDGGRVHLSSWQFWDKVRTNSLFGTFVSHSDPVAPNNWDTLRPGECRIQERSPGHKTFHYLDLGSNITIRSPKTTLVAPRAIFTGGGMWPQLTYTPTFSSQHNPIEMETYYDLQLSGGGWAPSMAWNRALYLSSPFELTPEFLGTYPLSESKDYVVSWKTPMSAQMVELQIAPGQKNGVRCRAYPNTSRIQVPAEMLKTLPAKGVLSIFAYNRHFVPFLNKRVTFYATQGNSVLYNRVP